MAEKFDVTVEAMDEANQGTNGYAAFYPGLKIVIPAKEDCSMIRPRGASPACSTFRFFLIRAGRTRS